MKNIKVKNIVEKGAEMVELTILIPCLNEEQTLGICIKKANEFLEANKIEGEVLIADNGSTDRSKEIANSLGARVVDVETRGYGSALINGSKQAKGKFTIMGDADDSYNFLEIAPLIDELKNGYDLVIGNRYKGKMEKGSMKLSHKYIGTPIISFIGRKIYKIQAKDFNCGLRAYVTDKVNQLSCESTGMEYATEMLIKAKKSGLKIKEVPINFYKDKRKKASHLNTVRDGIRHFKTIFANI